MCAVLKRAVTLGWMLAIVVFCFGMLLTLSAAATRLLTAPRLFPVITTSDSQIVHGQEIRRPSMRETVEQMGFESDFLVVATGISFLAVFIGACVVPWWYVRRTQPIEDADSRTVQELARVADGLTGRMESLEAILLDPSRNALEREREYR